MQWFFFVCLNAKMQKGTTFVFHIKGDYVLEMRSRGIMCIQTTTAKGLPWWLRGKESACQCKRHGFDLWSGKIPHAQEHLSPCATTTEPVCQEPVGHDREVTPAHHSWRKVLCGNEGPAQPNK